MKIAYICDRDSQDIHGWSGLNFFIRRALERFSSNLYAIDDLVSDASVKSRLRQLRWIKLYYRSIGRRFHPSRDEKLLRLYARIIQSRIAPDTEAVFAPSSLPLAFLEIAIPKFVYCDATFHCFVDYYRECSNLCRRTLRDGEKMERLALGRVDAAFYASEWAARSAIEDYQLPAEKTHVVPFGANLQQVPSLEQVTQWVAAKPPSICHLLFVGVDFIRKGGSLAVDVARILNQRGQPTILHLVGLERIPREVEAPFIRNYGFLSKHRAADQVVLEKLWRQSHFLIVPSLAECAGIVYAEASAHGMPSLARDTGGVSAMVKHQTNGFLLAANQEATDYATCIQSCLSDGNEYRRLSLSSYRFFEQCLNWDTAGRAMFETMARRTHGNASDSKLKAG